MLQPLLVCPADSPGYTRLLFAEPIGGTQAGLIVIAETSEGEFTIVLHGQREFDVPGEVRALVFSDGRKWKPKA